MKSIDFRVRQVYSDMTVTSKDKLAMSHGLSRAKYYASWLEYDLLSRMYLGVLLGKDK